MPNESANLKLKLYDPDADANALVYDLLKDICGYTNSNFVKIDTKTKNIDTSIDTLHNHIIGTDGNVVFYNKQEVFLAVHPVGSIFLSTSDVEPAGLYGGTWEKIAEERTLMGASAAHPVGTTAKAGLPNIMGTINSRPHNNDDLIYGCLAYATGAFEESMRTGETLSSITPGIPSRKSDLVSIDASRSNPIYGNSTTVQPPAYYLYIWKRIE